LQPLESTLPATTELVADRAFLARRRRERFVVYYEFYTQWDRNAPWDMLAKSGLLSQRMHLPTVCLAFVLRPRGFRSQAGQLQLAAAGSPTQHLWYREVCLWKVEPEPWWDKVPGLMALFPLCRHGQTPRAAIRHAADAIELTVAEQGEREDHLFLLYIFGELAYPRLDVEQMIGSNAMIRESRLGRKLLRQGQLQSRQADLLFVLSSRFGEDVAAELAPAVNSVDDPQLLEQLFQQSVTVASLTAFRAALKSLQG
jgi:hypothetical protein